MSNNKKSRSEITSADDKAIGFDYQYYYFLYCLLNLKEGETVGLEVKDDVHIDRPDGVTILSQLKHTVDPQSTNLTELDSDLWKTWYNWAKLIIEQSEDEIEETDKIIKQKNFCNSIKFVLVTNKAVGPRNKLLNKLSEFQNGAIDMDELRHYLTGLKSDSQDVGIYLKEVMQLNPEVLELFMRRISLETGFDDLVVQIIQSLREKMIPEARLDYLCKVLDGALRQANYSKIKNRERIVFSFDHFRQHYQLYFEIARSQELVVEDYGCDILNPLEQLFIKQLIEIEDICEDESDEIIRYTTYRLKVFNNLAQWIQQGLITEGQVDEFNEDAVARWRNIFRKAHRYPIRNEENLPVNILQMAHTCLDEVRALGLTLKGQQMGVELSNGQFYSLSDARKIGWIIDWKEKYGID